MLTHDATVIISIFIMNALEPNLRRAHLHSGALEKQSDGGVTLKRVSL